MLPQVLIGVGHFLNAGDAQIGSISQGSFRCSQKTFVRSDWHCFRHRIHGCIFQHACRNAFRVTNDGTTGRIFGFWGNSRELKREGVSDAHVTVVSRDEHWLVGYCGVEHLASGQLRRIPLLLVPVASGDPFTSGCRFRAIGDAFRELLRRGGARQFYAVELNTTVDEVDVSVIEPGQDEVLMRVENPCAGTSPGVDFRHAADGNDATADNRQSLSARPCLVDRVELSIGHDEIGGWTRLRSGRRRKEERRSKNRLHRHRTMLHSPHQRMPSFSFVRSTSKKVLRILSSVVWYCDLRQTTRSASLRGTPICPSMVRKASSPALCTSTEISTVSRTTSGLCESECGHTGATTNASTEGVRIGPPAASAYAVDPVGVEIIMPSAL